MPQRIDAGPVVAALGAVLLFLSLFLSWYEPDVSGWESFESLDLILAGVAIAAGVLAAGQLGARIAEGADLADAAAARSDRRRGGRRDAPAGPARGPGRRQGDRRLAGAGGLGARASPAAR